MAVVRLIKYSARETIETLRTLLAMAIRGELRGLAIAYRKADGSEHAIYTGAYRANPALAANASLRVSVTLMRANSDID